MSLNGSSSLNKNKKINLKKNKHYKRKKKVLSEKEEINNLEKLRCKLGEINPLEIKSFSLLPISLPTKKGLKEIGFIEPTEVQSQSLVHSLRDLDVVVSAKTGSGKTLAFLIPLLENLYKNMWTYLDGLGALIITPTRELAYQIYEVLNKVGKHHTFSAGLVIGGKDLKFEWHRVNRCNIIICTPGRLLQHMTENPEFNPENVQLLVLDEADQCLSLGFADAMNIILHNLPKDRQTLLFSATQTRDVKDLIRAGCSNPVFCSVHEHSKTVTPNTLKESYIVCEDHEKITFLWSFLKHHKRHKILVFLATCKQVKFTFDLFTRLRPGLTVMCLHGDMHQLRRMAVYDEFCGKKHAVLFATDVAARGLDIPLVDWVIQLDCPEDVTTYIHRAGRTARHTMSGETVLVVTSAQETPMISDLKMKNSFIEKLDIDPRKMQNIQIKIEATISKYINLKEEAVRAFKAYLKNISHMKNKRVFNVSSIDFDAYARSLGLAVTPRVRFIERKLKTQNDSPRVNSKLKPIFNVNQSDDEESDDDFLVSSKNKSKENTTDVATEDLNEIFEPISKKKNKVITKYAAVKKLLKKKVQLNNRVTFDEDGQPVLNPQRDMSSEHSGGAMKDDGLDISKMEEILKEEDKVDKKRHMERVKEKHRLRKEKEKAAKLARKEERTKMMNNEEENISEDDGMSDSGDDSFTENIIDELPDPGQIYDNKRKFDSDEEINAIEDIEGCDNSTSKNKKSRKTFSGRMKARQRAKEAKRSKLVESNRLAAIPFKEKEDLALFLLKGGK